MADGTYTWTTCTSEQNASKKPAMEISTQSSEAHTQYNFVDLGVEHMDICAHTRQQTAFSNNNEYDISFHQDLSPSYTINKPKGKSV
jgi:hypothetical protein